MDELTLKRILRSKIDSSLGYIGGELSTERAEMMDYYLGEPFGNEVDGRSQVVSTDVQDTIEKIMPTIMRIFESGGPAVEFEPENQEDVEMADIASKYCDYIYRRDNPGFLNTYTWIKDGLLQKTGVVKVYWDENEETRKIAQQGLTDDELAMVMQDPSLKVAEHTETVIQPSIPDGMGGMTQPIIGHDVVLEKTETVGRVKIAPVPPEEFLIDADARSLEEAEFVCHRVEKTIDELQEEGIDISLLKDLPVDSDENEFSPEAVARRQNDSATWFDDDMETGVNREVTVYECYIKIDLNGDGKSELRKITIAGTANEILDNEEVDIIPFCAWSPIIMPHRFTGRSIAELIKDIQLIKSTLLRNMLDNIYASNNQRHVINDKNVNISDMLISRPNGIIRTKGVPAEDVVSLGVNDMTGGIMNAMEYLDQIRKDRTSVGDEAAGLDPNVLANANSAVFAGAMEQARASIELIARVFAEVALKDLFRKVLYYVANYQTKPRMIRLTNKWVQIDPSEWRDKMNLIVKVGLGTGNKDKRIANLQQILNAQKEALPEGLTTKENIHNALVDITEAMEEQSERYWPDPSQIHQQPQPDPAQSLIQGELAKEKVRQDQDDRDSTRKAMVDLQKIATDAGVPIESLGAYQHLQPLFMQLHQNKVMQNG